ncbi:MAG TPA: toll/interleukin-1 receptor domain-containing protein [Thermoanaerobaculia bacterium]|nr:toll/interleukin-1 receptor domain-containing protein [Thermoanaerobaculia bacterium]
MTDLIRHDGQNAKKGSRRDLSFACSSGSRLDLTPRAYAPSSRLAPLVQRTSHPGAKQWLDEIGAALDRCDWFVVLLTPSSVRSKWVKRELTYALNQDRYEDRIVPLLVERCDYTKLAWPLATVQIIPFGHFTAGCETLFSLWSIPYQRK